MSKYTTELRNYLKSVYPNDVDNATTDEIITNGITHLFDFNFPYFTPKETIEDYISKTDFEKMFCKHFYMREIGLETIDLFKLKLEDYLNVNMPYYNKVLKGFYSKLNFLLTDNITITHDETGSNNKSSNYSNNGNNTSESANSGGTIHTYLNTPQGKLDNFMSDNYLTSAQKSIALTGSNQPKTNTSSNYGHSGNGSENIGTTKNYTHNENGYRNINPNELIIKYYESIRNVYNEIINGAEPLFMQLW